MKRYRVINHDFDARANILNQEIGEDWEENAKKLFLQNKEMIIQEMIYEFGAELIDNKVQNTKDIGMKPLSVLAYHNNFLEQTRRAFVMGAYYPALTSVCALGERILNHLILKFRDEFKSTKEYKKVYRKSSIDDWTFAIDILEAWNILRPEVVDKYRSLMDIRHKSIHFTPATDIDDRRISLEAIKLVQEIVQLQFGSFGSHPWFIDNIPGEAYIKKECEGTPFIKLVYLPQCSLVGPRHKLENVHGCWQAVDDNQYDSHEITDDEFATLRKGCK